MLKVKIELCSSPHPHTSQCPLQNIRKLGDLTPKFIWIQSLIPSCTAPFLLQSAISSLIPHCSHTSTWTTAMDSQWPLLSPFHPVYTAIEVINLKYESADVSSLLKLFLWLIKPCTTWSLHKFSTSSLASFIHFHHHSPLQQIIVLAVYMSPFWIDFVIFYFLFPAFITHSYSFWH